MSFEITEEWLQMMMLRTDIPSVDLDRVHFTTRERLEHQIRKHKLDPRLLLDLINTLVKVGGTEKFLGQELSGWFAIEIEGRRIAFWYAKWGKRAANAYNAEHAQRRYN